MPRCEHASGRPAYLTHLEDLNLGGVCGSDVEALQIWLKHPLHGQSSFSSSPVTLLGASWGSVRGQGNGPSE